MATRKRFLTMLGLLKNIYKRRATPGAASDMGFRKVADLFSKIWPESQKRDGREVFLISFYSYPASVIANAYVTNAAARRTGARIAFYDFEKIRCERTQTIYEAFGARCELDWKDREAFRTVAEAAADRLMQGVSSKEDVLGLVYETIFIGDLVYDTYLRKFSKATIDITDPRLRDIVAEAICNYHAFRQYLSKNKVVGMIIDHHYYVSGGVMARVAHEEGIPIIHYGFTDPFYLYRVPTITTHNGSKSPARHDSERFPVLLDGLSEQERAKAREIGRAKLEEYLSGRGNYLIYGHIAPFSEHNGDRLMPDTGRPRILVMLQEFCDAPNCLGKLLFPDFYEWIMYLLKKAEQTAFDWVIKPHACLQIRERTGMNEENARVVAEIRRKFPRFQVLDPSASNRQILQEGISAMFTVRGSGAYEMAYLGVPVVTAGKAFYSSYNFTHDAKTLEQFDHLIANADKLECPAKKDEVAEFYYVFRDYLKDFHGVGCPLFPETIMKREDHRNLLSSHELYDAFASEWSETYHNQLEAALGAALAKI